MENCNISIKVENYRSGIVYGTIDEMEWYALVNKEKSLDGIDPNNLRTGEGRIIKLCVFKDIVEEEGNPFKLIFKTSRFIYAEYNSKWEVLNVKYNDLVYNLVNYLEKRYSFKLIIGNNI